MSRAAFRRRRCGPVASGVLWSWALVTLFGTVTCCAQSSVGLTTAIPPQPLAEALAAYTHQTGMQLIYESELARGLRSKGAPAGLAPEAALARLLEGTGLRYEFLNERGVRILAAKRKAPPARAPPHTEHRDSESLSSIEEVVVTAEQRDER